MVMKTFLYSFAAVSILGCSASFAEEIHFNYGTVEQTYTKQKPDGRVVSPTIQKKHIGQPKYEDVSQGATLNGKPITTTVNPALKGSTVGGSTGPTKPPLPTTGTQHR
jgi:hypothetical protein